MFSNEYFQPQNIYITSDEEIKRNDYYIYNNRVRQSAGGEQEKGDYRNCKKIILTTDPNLIKDGVQAIHDEFLEWFVKNPSCEYVNIEKYHGINTSIAEVNTISGDGSLSWQGRSDLRDYKIIIPKEEPKQETLEEVAERFYGEEEIVNDYDISGYLQSAFLTGAKWQTERMYNEEDMIEYANFTSKYSIISPKEWFEQFKKK
jgi:hypothetical protein